MFLLLEPLVPVAQGAVLLSILWAGFVTGLALSRRYGKAARKP